MEVENGTDPLGVTPPVMPSAGRSVVAFLNRIKAQDLAKVREVVAALRDRGVHAAQPSPSSTAKRAGKEEEEVDDDGLMRRALVEDMRFLADVSRMVSEVSYKKGSVKDRFRDIPWHNIEHLFVLLKRALSAMMKMSGTDAGMKDHGEEVEENEREEEEVVVSLCAIAVPLIMREDMPELHERLSALLHHQDEEMEVFEGSISEESVLRTVVTVPPATGLVHIVKLTHHFMDGMQLNALLDHMRPLINSNYDGSRLHKYALMRMLTIIGESTKYMSPHLKAVDKTIPWKNIEKVRDLLGHVSRVPIREAVQSLLEGRVIRGANLAEDSDDHHNHENEDTSDSGQERVHRIDAKSQPEVSRMMNDKEDDEEPSFSRKVIPLPPTLLRDVCNLDLITLHKKFTHLRDYHKSLHFRYRLHSSLLLPALFLLFATIPIFLTSTSSAETSSSSLLFRGSLIGAILLSIAAWFATSSPLDGICSLLPDSLVSRQRKDPASIWRSLPHPSVYQPQNQALRRYSKMKEREIEEKRRRQQLEHQKQADGANDSDEELMEMMRELTDAMMATKEKKQMESSGEDDKQSNLDEEEKAKLTKYRKALKHEITLNKDDTKLLWLLITDKTAKKRWAQRLWGKDKASKRVKPKMLENEGLNQAAINQRKLLRKQELIKLHQNSTLNKEGKLHADPKSGREGARLKNLVLLRKFLQNPTETKEDQSILCVKFIISTLREVEQLLKDEMPVFLASSRSDATTSSPSSDDSSSTASDQEDDTKAVIRHIREHPLLQYALQFQIGLYALYAAQVKWWYPHLLGLDHVAMRDSVMHGKGHSYSFHLSDQGIEEMLGHLSLMLRLRPSLEAALKQMRQGLLCATSSKAQPAQLVNHA